MSWRRPSLLVRLVAGLVAVSVVLTGLAALALDALYRELALQARQEVLDAQVIALIATAELDESGMLVPDTLAEARLATPGSGLFAEIRDATGVRAWRSPSALGTDFGLGARPLAGERIYREVMLGDGTRLLSLSLGVSWETGGGSPATFIISAAESLEPYHRQLARVRARLLAGSLLLMGALVTGLTLAVRAGLRPLARLEREIAAVESGERELLGPAWPRELAGVTANLNALLAGERERLSRYRSTLGNLAHSLKTPLAAMGSLLSSARTETGELRRELDRMQAIVDHQLRRAAVGGAGSSVAAIPVGGVLDDLASALQKVYRDKAVAIELQLAPGLVYPIEAGDLMELAGNLLDNAFKYGRRHVRLRGWAVERADWRRPGLELEFEDDGPGITPADRSRVMRRGTRADETVPGQGIGLSAAADLVAAYDGSLAIGDSELGGAAIRVSLPGR